MPLPTLLLIHGAWHSPKCWYKIIPLLEAESFKCIAPHMLFTSQDPPVKSIQPDIDMLQEIIKQELTQGNDVVVLGHSLGGLVSSSCIQGLLTPSNAQQPHEKGHGRILGMVQVCSILVPSGRSPNDARNGEYAPFAEPDFSTGWVKFVGDPYKFFYNDVPREEAEKYVSWLENQSLYLFQGREGVYAGYLDVPVWYIHCTEDYAIPYSRQQLIVEGARAAGAKIITRTVDAGHSPFYSTPTELVELICEAVDALSASEKDLKLNVREGI